MNELYKRQAELDLAIPNKVGIIGVGGIGSWVAFNLALVGVPNLLLVDDDIIEEHNLNRTPFRLLDIGTHKTKAISELIRERRNTTIINFDKKTTELTEIERKMIARCDVLIDCRDNTLPLDETLINKVFVKTGYDGTHVTLDFFPKYTDIWGENEGYTVTPSYLVPPQFVAGLVVQALVSGYKEIKTTSFDINKVITDGNSLEDKG